MPVSYYSAYLKDTQMDALKEHSPFPFNRMLYKIAEQVIDHCEEKTGQKVKKELIQPLKPFIGKALNIYGAPEAWTTAIQKALSSLASKAATTRDREFIERLHDKVPETVLETVGKIGATRNRVDIPSDLLTYMVVTPQDVKTPEYQTGAAKYIPSMALTVNSGSHQVDARMQGGYPADNSPAFGSKHDQKIMLPVAHVIYQACVPQCVEISPDTLHDGKMLTLDEPRCYDLIEKEFATRMTHLTTMIEQMQGMTKDQLSELDLTNPQVQQMLRSKYVDEKAATPANLHQIRKGEIIHHVALTAHDCVFQNVSPSLSMHIDSMMVPAMVNSMESSNGSSDWRTGCTAAVVSGCERLMLMAENEHDVAVLQGIIDNPETVINQALYAQSAPLKPALTNFKTEYELLTVFQEEFVARVMGTLLDETGGRLGFSENAMEDAIIYTANDIAENEPNSPLAHIGKHINSAMDAVLDVFERDNYDSSFSLSDLGIHYDPESERYD